MTLPPKERYLFVLPWTLRQSGAGVDEVVTNLIQEFQRNGRLEPLLWSNEAPNPAPCETVCTGRSLVEPLDDQRPVRALCASLVLLPVTLLRLILFIKRARVRVVNIHFPPSSAIYWVLLRKLHLFGGTVLISIHGSDIAAMLQGNRCRNMFWRFVLRGADGIVTCSQRLSQEVHKLDAALRPTAIHNGIDITRFREECNQNWQLPSDLQDKRVILHLGAFVRMQGTSLIRKGQDVLVKAFHVVAPRFPDACLMLAGTGPCLEEIRELVMTLGLVGRVYFIGHVAHQSVIRLFKSVEVFVLASRYEGFPIALLEAAAAHVPIVTTDAGGSAELIENRVTGYVVPIGDEAALAASIADALGNPEMTRALAAKCHILVRDDFTWRRACERYLHLVDLVSEGSPRDKHRARGAAPEAA